MASLEVHAGNGQVEYITIRPEQPVTFGSDPKCDIVLNGSGILPFHGRIGWKGEKYRIEAFPEARSLDFNGKKVIAASFRTGDEIRVGNCVIYMASADEVATPKAKAVESAPAPPKAPRPAASPAATAVAEPDAKPPAASLLDRFTGRNAPPGEEKVLSSPLVLGLVLAMILLTGTGIYLWKSIKKSAADELYVKATENFDKRAFADSKAQFDKFLQGHLDDPRVSKARVLYWLSEVHLFASGATPSWTNVLAKAREMIDNVSNLPEYQDEKLALATIVLQAAEGIADRAKSEADAKLLKETESANRLFTQIAGKGAESLRAKSKFPAKFAEAQAAVTRAQVRAASLATMDAAVKAGVATDVYKARDELLLRYPDLAADAEIFKRLDSANDLIRKVTDFDGETRPAQTTARPEPLGPPTSLVLRLDADKPASPNGTPVFAIAEGFAYALDGATGAPLWHTAVGLTCPFVPVQVTGGTPSVLAFDARYNELVRLNAKTGELIWRQEIGEPIADPPLMLGNQVVVASPAGRITQIGFENGEIRGSLDLGRRLARSPVADESAKYLYVLGEEANLFLISLERNRMSCVDVEYTGHAVGAIPCSPARIGRYLVVVDNNRPADGRWIIFLLDEDGSKARKVQEVPVAGWTWSTPTAAGKTIWSTSDRGAIGAYTIGEYNSNEPFKLIARVVPDADRSGPSFARARSERELWRSSALSARFDLDPDRGAINMGWTLQEAGPAIAPIQSADRLVVFTHQYSEGQGVGLWGLNPSDGKVAWRTVVGAPWIAHPASNADASGLVTAAADGRPITLGADQLRKGGFIQQPLSRPGSPKSLDAGARIVRVGDLSLTFPTAKADHYLLTESEAPPTRVNLPDPLAADPISWAGGLLVPAANGWVYLLDPKTGEPKADPYMPSFDRARPLKWRTPARVDDESVIVADESGRVHRLVIREDPRARLVAQPIDPVDLDSAIVADPAILGTAVVLATADDRIRFIGADNLSSAGTAKLEAARAVGPVSAGAITFVADQEGRLLAFGTDAKLLWTAPPGGAPITGAPLLADGSGWTSQADGEFRRIDLKDGSTLERAKAEMLPDGGLMPVGDAAAIGVAPGTVRLFRPSPSNP